VATPADNSLHSGVFQASVSLVKADMVVAGDDTLQALPGDELRVVYLDEVHVRDGSRQVQAVARCLEGHIGGVRVTRAVISDQELRIQTQLKTADALTNIGNRYKEFGLRDKSNEKYEQALAVCEEIMEEARKLGGGLLEQTYVQLWRIYFERDQLDLAAAMCQRLQNEFPNSGFVDDALLQLGDVARKQGNLNRAIGIFTRIANMPKSQLRGDAQFGIAECYEQLATEATAAAATQMQDRAFQEYKKVYDQFPDSGRVGEAVAKMANYYYQQKDFSRAIDTFETVLNDHPDAKFLDVILFNYGRCLYRMDRRGEAKRRFDQLIGDFPESPLAADAKKISEALSKAAAESP
jgi:tetratricopeptide (TPR) repeat protein